MKKTIQNLFKNNYITFARDKRSTLLNYSCAYSSERSLNDDQKYK